MVDDNKIRISSRNKLNQNNVEEKLKFFHCIKKWKMEMGKMFCFALLLRHEYTAQRKPVGGISIDMEKVEKIRQHRSIFGLISKP